MMRPSEKHVDFEEKNVKSVVEWGIPMRIQAIFASALVALVTSCASITSSDKKSEPQNSVHRAEAAYSLARTVLTVKASAGKLTVTKSAEPDPEARFMLRYAASPFSDDLIDLEVDPSSLLLKVSAQATDRTDDIAVNLAKILFTIGTNGATLAEGRQLPSDPVEEKSFIASYDPLEVREAQRVRQPLANAGYCILVGNEVDGGPAFCDGGGGGAVEPGRNPVRYLKARSGVFYRQQASLPVAIYAKAEKTGWTPLFIGNETFFDKKELYEVAINRALFVEKKVDLSFQSGALNKVTIKKDSELLALSTAGLTIVKTVVAIPFEAINQNKALTQAKADYLKARTNEINNRNELLKLGVQQGSLAQTDVDLIAAGRSLGGSDALTSDILQVCRGGLAASVTDCERYRERDPVGY